MIPMKINDIVRIKIGNACHRDGLTNNSILVKVVLINQKPDYAGYSFSAEAIDPKLNKHYWWYKPEEILPSMPNRPRKGKLIGEQVFQP